MKYQIKKVYRCGVKLWLVLPKGGDIEIARFALKREAVAYILRLETR